MNENLRDSRFLRACRREPVDHTPIWLMRQAGRYMPEYRALREKYSLLELCRTPDLATEVTLQPIRRFGFDAAILFADILLPIVPMGLKLEFAKGEGPVIENPVSDASDVDALHVFEVEEGLGFVLDAVRRIVPELGPVPLIGFAGAPFTLASYMIEGGFSRNFIKTKSLMLHHPMIWHTLMEKIADVTSAYLQKQVEAGASAVQLFDSWVGALGPREYEVFALPYSRRVLSSINAPTIHFSTGTSGYLNLIAEAGGDVISVDWRVRLDEAWKNFPSRAIQGNLDPVSLLGPWEELAPRVHDILKQANKQPGHIFNLGHGVFPETPTENVERLVEEVHQS